MRQFWNDFQPLWFCTEFDLCWQWQSATVEEMGMWGECFIYFFLTFQWSPWRIMWRLWNGCKTVGWWLHLERTMESSKPLIQFCGWTTCKQTTLVFTNALSLLTVDVKFSHLENWGWEVLLLLFPCLIFQFEELLKKSRQILSRNQNINKNSGADWSVRYLRGKTIIKKENWDWDWKIRYIFLFFRHFAYIVLLLYWSDSAAWASGQPQVFSLRKSHT